MTDQRPSHRESRPGVRQRLEHIAEHQWKNLIAVLEDPNDIRNIGSVIRNVNALGIGQLYVISDRTFVPDTIEEMRSRNSYHFFSAAAIHWTNVRVFRSTQHCFSELDSLGFTSVVTSPAAIGKNHCLLDNFDATMFPKIAVWFGNEGRGISTRALDGSHLCISIPNNGMVESLNVAVSSGIVLHEITRQLRHQRSLRVGTTSSPE